MSPSEATSLPFHTIAPPSASVATSAVSSWLLWRGQLWLALVVGWLPSVLVTAAMVRWMDFSRQRDSRFGRNSSVASAGESVSALKAESATAIAVVTANCW